MTITHIARSLQDGRGLPGRLGRLVDGVPGVRAAVAVVLRDGELGPEVLLLHRSDREGDPWSGHVSFPGGRAAREDTNLRATAARECREEAGVDPLDGGRALGRLPALVTRAHRQRRLMTVTPWVFVTDERAVTTTNHEARDAFWVPLEFFRERRNRDRMAWRLRRGRRLSVAVPVPCYRWEGHLIWGLTLAILDRLVRL